MKRFNQLIKYCQKGQNTVEYILVFAAVVAVLIIALGPNGFVTKSIDRSVNHSFEAVGVMANNIDDSY